MQGRGVEDRPGPAARGTKGEHEASFGARLKRLRDAAGLTQEELAFRAGLTAKAVSALERGVRRRPYPHTVRSLADALDLTDAERASLQAAVPGRGEKVGAPDAGTPPAVLPTPVTALVGRERDVEAVVGLIGGPETRLLTLPGPGDVGKTRLATEVARALLAAVSFPDGAFFVALAPLADASLVLPTIARSLPEAGETESLSSSAALRAYLRDKRLLVLDNFERLLEAAPEVAVLMEACPGLAVLATSRAPLRLPGSIPGAGREEGHRASDRPPRGDRTGPSRIHPGGCALRREPTPPQRARQQAGDLPGSRRDRRDPRRAGQPRIGRAALGRRAGAARGHRRPAEGPGAREVRAPSREGPRRARRGGLRGSMGRGPETHA